MTDTPTHAPLVVVGAGPGGYAAAFHAAARGIDAILVDPDPNPGGVCLYRGCIPSKALLHVAQLIRESRRAADWGVRFEPPDIDVDRLRAWKDGVVRTLTDGLGQLRSRRGVAHIQGRAHFANSRTLHVETTSGQTRIVTFEHAIVATGSTPIALPAFPKGSARVWDSTDALDLPEIPDRLLVVGGGYIGLELSSAYSALGSRVTVVEMLDGLLAGVDRDLVRPLHRRLEADLEEILLETRVASVEERDDGLHARLENRLTGESERRFDRVLVSVGRRPSSGGLALETTAAVVDEAGYLQVDSQMRTAEPSIFAIGDVVGQPMLAHKASHEARVAVEAAAGGKAHFDPAAEFAIVPLRARLSIDELATLPFKEAKARWLAYFDTGYLTQLLARCDNNVAEAARQSGIDRVHLFRLIKKYGIQR